MALDLYVKINGKYKQLSAVAVGPHLKDIRKVRLRNAIQKYIDTCTSQKCLKNQTTEKIYFQKFLKFMLKAGVKNTDDISQEFLDAFISDLSSKMKPVSVNRRMSSIGNFLNKAYEWKFIHRKFEIKKKKFARNPHRVWPEEVFNEFLKHTDQDHKAFFKFLWVTGCRPIEAANLKWTDIDYEKKLFTLSCGKNSEIARSFPLTKETDQIIHSITMSGPNIFSTIGRNYTKRKQVRKPMNTGLLYLYVKDRLKRFTKEKLTMYGLRHSFGFRLNQAGANAFVIAHLMGHSDLKTTRGYMHTSETDLLSILKKVQA